MHVKNEKDELEIDFFTNECKKAAEEIKEMLAKWKGEYLISLEVPNKKEI